MELDDELWCPGRFFDTRFTGLVKSRDKASLVSKSYPFVGTGVVASGTTRNGNPLVHESRSPFRHGFGHLVSSGESKLVRLRGGGPLASKPGLSSTFGL